MSEVDDISNILTYARLKPSKKLSSSYTINFLDKSINFNIPHNISSGYINNSKESYNYKYNGDIFDTNVSQATVFETVAKPVALSVLEDGQTGSGKTFSITGGLERYEDRGIIPRTIAFLFEQIEKQTEWRSKLHVSYLEIYNDKGFDLLDEDRDDNSNGSLDSLHQVRLYDTSDGIIELKGLRAPHCESEEAALNYMFIGDTNRSVCETPMNDASTRSHCIFTIYVESSKIGSGMVRRSKLHLVDLAGSERGASFKIDNVKTLSESKHINLSLHYLEMCISALHDQANTNKSVYIPYRNCMMTSVLKDSLGGNCKTVMLATLSGETDNLLESVGTCRFAQRVASIRNKAEINEELDPKLLIKKLKAQIQDLKEEIATLKGESINRSMSLNDEEKEHCKHLVQGFVKEEDNQEFILPMSDPKKVAEMFFILRSMLLKKGPIEIVKSEPYVSEDHLQLISSLKQQVATQNHEINSLVCILREKDQAKDSDASIPTPRVSSNLIADSPNNSSTPLSNVKIKIENPIKENKTPSQSSAVMEAVTEQVGPDHTKLLMQRNTAFDEFRKSYKKNQAIQDNQNILKDKYAQAKQLGLDVNACRDKINELKEVIAQLRVEQAAQGLAGQTVPDSELTDLMQKMQQYQQAYKEKFTTLKHLKTEIEHLQLLLEKIRKELQRDFEAWWVTSVSSDSVTKAPSISMPLPSTSSKISISNNLLSPQANQSSSPPNSSNFQPFSPNNPTNKVLLNQSTPVPVRANSIEKEPMLTGNPKADEEIMKFYRLRQATAAINNNQQVKQ